MTLTDGLDWSGAGREGPQESSVGSGLGWIGNIGQENRSFLRGILFPWEGAVVFAYMLP